MSGAAARHIAIVGAGIGGLVAAVDLAAKGWRVTVLERASAPGGKMREIEVGGRPIDAGPTVFTMRWVFDQLFRDAGTTLEHHLTLDPAETLARHAWDGGQTLDLFADKKRSADAIGQFAGAKDAAGYLAFCAQAARTYRTLEEPFIKAPRPTASDLVRATGLIRAMRLKPFATMWSAIGGQMRDPRLRQLFARYATYCGTSPFAATATLMLVAHVEQEGVWLIRGGMHRLAAALAALATAHGATIRYDTPVREIVVAGRAKAVRLEDGEIVTADAVIMNGEPNALATGLLGRKASDAAQQVKFPARSLSAVTWAGMVETEGLPLLRHNVFFSGDYKLEFDLINTGMLPTEPTIYICAQDRGDRDGPAPAGPERALMLVNAPPNGDRRSFTQVEIDQCMQGMSSLLSRCGLQMRFTQPAVMTGPAQFHRLFPASGGALYGRSVTAGFATFKRPENRTSIPGLYLAGGSTHPGAGVPMAALSGRRAAAEVMEDLSPRRRPALMRLFRRGATPGGTSTP